MAYRQAGLPNMSHEHCGAKNQRQVVFRDRLLSRLCAARSWLSSAAANAADIGFIQISSEFRGAAWA